MNNLQEINVTEEIIRKKYWDKALNKPYGKPQLKNISNSWFKEEFNDIYDFRDNYIYIYLLLHINLI